MAYHVIVKRIPDEECVLDTLDDLIRFLNDIQYLNEFEDYQWSDVIINTVTPDYGFEPKIAPKGMN